MKKIFLLFIVLFTSLQIHAQQKEISGTIADEDNLPLPGVDVVVKGTENSTTTDFDGNYTILADSSDVLLFSYLGISFKKIVGNNFNISFVIKLQELFPVAQMGCYFGRQRIEDHVTYQYVTIKFN